MKKSKVDRKVNQVVHNLHRQLQDDVFGHRFELRQKRKTVSDGVHYYLYELRDNQCPANNRLVKGWLNEFEIITFHALHVEMNNFIVESDFWSTHLHK